MIMRNITIAQSNERSPEYVKRMREWLQERTNDMKRLIRRSRIDAGQKEKTWESVIFNASPMSLLQRASIRWAVNCGRSQP